MQETYIIQHLVNQGFWAGESYNSFKGFIFAEHYDSYKEAKAQIDRMDGLGPLTIITCYN